MPDFTIRKGTPEDLPRTLELIRELAEYERALEEVDIDEDTLYRDGFSENPLFGLYVAENEMGVQGIALYFFRYSTWKGKTLFLEDIVVSQNQRGKGLGKGLFETMIKVAKEENCKRMSWQVLEWNEPSIKFYKKYNANLDADWINCDLYEDDIQGYSS